MTLFRRFFLAFCFFLVSFLSLAQTKFTPEQKALLKEALRVSVSTNKNLPDYALLPSKEKISLYDKMVSLEEPAKPVVYLTKDLVPKFKNVKFELKNEAQLFDTTRKEDFIFLRVMQINQPEGDYGLVTVMAQIALGSESREKGFLHKKSSGLTMLFKKTKNDWQFEKVVNTLPNLVDYKLRY